jgi:hypothetical protein
LLGSDKGLTTAEAIKILEDNKASYATLRSVLTTRKGELVGARSLGMMLAKVRGRAVNHKSIQQIAAGKKTHAWKVIEHPKEDPKGGTSGTSETCQAVRAENCTDSCSRKKRWNGAEMVPLVPLVPPGEGETDPQNGADRERFSL